MKGVEQETVTSPCIRFITGGSFFFYFNILQFAGLLRPALSSYFQLVLNSVQLNEALLGGCLYKKNYLV